MTKYSFWVLSLLFFLISKAFLFPITTFACSKAFQPDIKPEQLKDRLLLIAQNKIEEIKNLNIEPCGPHCLSFYSQTGLRFQIKKDSSLTKPKIVLSPTSKILKIPSTTWLKDSSSDNYLKSWLIGHEIHPYTGPSKIIQYTEAQNTAFIAVKQALNESVKSFLHIAPTSAGKTLVLARALKEKLQNYRKKKISFVTAHQIHLVDQLFEAVQQELKGTDVTIINWNEKSNKDFDVEIERSIGRSQATVFVITSQSLKQQLDFFQGKNLKTYNRLIENIDGIYIDEAHHLGAFHTKEALLVLKEQSEAFLYGTTATPVHHEINLREFFEREHWSYLNTIEKGNLFASHPAEKVIEQLAISIEKGEITPFDNLYVISENGFNITKEYPLFIQPINHLRVLNPHHYNTLVGILYPIIQSNKKGFIVTATIAEANRLTDFLNEAIEGVTFEAYHSDMTKEQKQKVLNHSEKIESHYIVAVRALDEGVNLPHLSAYIDLNVNVPVKQMVHRIGRVLRLHPGKMRADILLLADYRNEAMAADLLHLLDTVNVLNFHGGIKYNRASGDSHLRNSEIVPLTREELKQLRDESRLSIRAFWSNQKREKPSYEELIEILISKSILLHSEWKIQRETDLELQHIPKRLSQAYKEWTPNGGWQYVRKKAGVVGVEKVYKNKPTYEGLIEILISKKIFSGTNWREQRETDPELQHIPKYLYGAYKEWNLDGGWEFVRKKAGVTGIGRPSYKDRPTYEELVEILISKNIFSIPKWKKQRKTDPELQHIPKVLSQNYKEWNKNGGWQYVRKKAGVVGVGRAHRGKPSYEELIEILISKKIFSGTKWKEQRETDPELQYIPKNLYEAYEKWNLNRGWEYVRKKAGVTGIGRSSYKDKPSYKELIEILISKNIFSGTEWKIQRETDPELQHIPKRLSQDYKEWNLNRGWEFVRKKAGVNGLDKPSYKRLIEILISKNIFSGTEWKIQRETDPELQHIPKVLSQNYKEWNENGGWKYVKKKAGVIQTGRAVYKDKPTYEELIEILISKNIFFDSEWKIQREIDPALQHIPKHLSPVYTKWTLNGGWQYVQKKAGLTGISSPSYKDKPTYEGLIEILISKNIFSDSEWKTQREIDPDLQHIPKHLSPAYTEWAPNGGWQYVLEKANKEKNTGTKKKAHMRKLQKTRTSSPLF